MVKKLINVHHYVPPISTKLYLLGIIQLGQLAPGGVVVKHLVVTLHESRADGVEIRVEGHPLS